MRKAIIGADGVVQNIIVAAIGEGVAGAYAGFTPPDGSILVDDPDCAASIGGAYRDGKFFPAPVPESIVPPRPPSFAACDLIDQLTVSDLEAIEAATAKNTDLRLLWIKLRARGPGRVNPASDEFAVGWRALGKAIGAKRASEIADAIGLKISSEKG